MPSPYKGSRGKAAEVQKFTEDKRTKKIDITAFAILNIVINIVLTRCLK